MSFLDWYRPHRCNEVPALPPDPKRLSVVVYIFRRRYFSVLSRTMAAFVIASESGAAEFLLLIFYTGYLLANLEPLNSR